MSKRRQGYLILLLLPLMFVAIYIATQLGLIAAKPDDLPSRIDPLTTANYREWQTLQFQPVDPILGTLVALEAQNGPTLAISTLSEGQISASQTALPQTLIAQSIQESNSETQPEGRSPAGSDSGVESSDGNSENSDNAPSDTNGDNSASNGEGPSDTGPSTNPDSAASPPASTAAQATANPRTETQASSPTITRTPTPARTQSATPATSPAATQTPLRTATQTPIATNTLAPQATQTFTLAATSTPIPPTQSPTHTYTHTPVNTPTTTFTASHTHTPTDTFTASATHTHTATFTASHTATHTATFTPTFTPSHTHTATNTPTITNTPTATNTPDWPVDYQIGISVDNPTPSEGQTVTLTASIAWQSGLTGLVTGVQVRARVPNGLTYVSHSLSDGLSYNPASGVWVVDMAGGDVKTLTIIATANEVGATRTINATASLLNDSVGNDTTPANNSASTTIQVENDPWYVDYAVTITADTLTPSEGGAVRLTVSVQSLITGGQINGLEIQSLLPAGLIYQSHTLDGGSSYNPTTGLWDFNLGYGAVKHLYIVALVDSGTAGNLITISAAMTNISWAHEYVSSNNSSTLDLVILPPAVDSDLRLGLNVTNSAPPEGGTITTIMTVRNHGPADVTDVEAMSQLPAGLTLISHGLNQGLYDQGTGLWQIGDLPSGALAILTLTTLVDMGTADLPLLASANISAFTGNDPDTSNNSADLTIIPISTGPQIDLVVSLSGPDDSGTGSYLSYLVTVNNSSVIAATDVQIWVDLPAGLTITGSSGAGNFDHSSGFWTVGTLNPGVTFSRVVNVYVTPSLAGATVTTVATINAAGQSDPNTANNRATHDLNILNNGLELTQSASNTTPLEGETLTYTLVVRSFDSIPVTGIQVTDSLPFGVSYIDSNASQGGYDWLTGIWNVGQIDSGGVAALTLTVQATTGGAPITNTATITAADQPDPNPANNTASTTIYPVVVGSDADLQVELFKLEPESLFTEGQQVNTVLRITNHGPDAASGVTLAYALPYGLLYDSHTAGQGHYDIATGVWSVGNVSIGGTLELTVRVGIDSGTAGTTQTATLALLTLDQTDPNGGNNNASLGIVVAGADLELTQWVSNPAPLPNDTIIYTLRLENRGPGSPNSVLVQDQLPAGVSYSSASASQGFYDIGTFVWDVGPMAAGQVVTLDLIATVDGGTIGQTITNQATITYFAIADLNLGNNSAGATLTVQAPPADLSLGISPTNATPTEGDTFSYILTLSNSGDTGVTAHIQVNLPAGVVAGSAITSAGVYDSGSGVWIVAPASGASLEIPITIPTGIGITSLDYQAAIIYADRPDPDPTYNTVFLPLTVVPAPPPPTSLESDLSLSIIVDQPTPTQGSTITVTITLNNPSASDISGVAVAINPPNGYTPTHVFDPVWVSLNGDGYLVNVTAGGSTSFGYTALVDATIGATLTDHARITALGVETNPPYLPITDPDAANNEGTINMIVQ